MKRHANSALRSNLFKASLELCVLYGQCNRLDTSVKNTLPDNSMDHGLDRNRRQDSMATPSSSTPPPRRIRTLAQSQNHENMSASSSSTRLIPTISRKALERSCIAKQIPATRSLTLMLITFAASFTVGVISAQQLARCIEQCCVDSSPKCYSYFSNEYGFDCATGSLRV
ncbi:hypothetical protein Aduo_019435 [Ancylostoma duodenale]